MTPAVAAWTLATAAGIGRAAFERAVAANATALRPNDDAAWPVACWVGRLDVPALPGRWSAWDCRATRLAWAALHADGFIDAVQAARGRHGRARIGLVLGTSAATIEISERAYARGSFADGPDAARINTPHGVADFVAALLDIAGPVLTVSTACSSSARAFSTAERWLRLGLADAVVVAGVDGLSGSLLHGFGALQLLSPDACRPFAADRRGISIGEAAGFALLARDGSGPRLLGHGESNDAHHMSSPQPQGLGAGLALDAALVRAGIDAGAVDVLHLHGTASALNDAVEAALVARRYRSDVHACATKGLTGHTMGAAGIVGAAACWLALQHGLATGSAGTDAPDPAFGDRFAAQLHTRPARRATRIAASHAFGFGGNNAVLVFG